MQTLRLPPPVFKLPLGIFLLVLAVLVTGVLGAAGLLDVEALHHYRHIIRDKTGQYIARVNYALKLRQDGQQQDR